MAINETIFPTEADIPEKYKFAPVEQRRYLVNGELREWTGPMQEVLSPVFIRNADGSLTQKRLGSYPLMDKKTALEALAAADKAKGKGLGEWAMMHPKKRMDKHIVPFLEWMARVADPIANALMWETGKTAKDSRKEVDRTVVYGYESIKEVSKMERKAAGFEEAEGDLGHIGRSSIGNTLCMGPFNYPLNEILTIVLPALMMGNTVVFKPARYGVLLHEPLLEAYQRFFPAGVVNTIYGDGAQTAGPIMSSGKIDVLAFIGSTKVANILKNSHPYKNRLKGILGLGAKNLGIVLKDSNLENTVKQCVLGSLSFNGQRCTALKALYVERSIADKFTEMYSAAVDKLKIGMPWQDGVSLTPLPEPGKPEAMLRFIEDAVRKGAKLVRGGEMYKTLFDPAVLYPVNYEMKIAHQEQFGPVVPIIPFDDISEPITHVQKSQYRQQASIFGRDPKRLGYLFDALTNLVCKVNLNAQCKRSPDNWPFCGKINSGETVLSIREALYALSSPAMVATEANDTNRQILSEIMFGGYSQFLSQGSLLARSSSSE